MLGAELSLAAHLADVSEELRALAERSPDTSPHRSGEPYRLAVSGIYARLTATALRLEVETTRRPVGEAAPYASVEGIQGRSRRARSLADREQFRRDRARPAAAVAPRGGLLRLPSRPPRHQAEFRRARTHGRRTDRRRDARHVLSGAERGGPDRAAAERTAQRAAADLGLRQVQRGDAGRTRAVPCRGRGARQIRRRCDPPMHHLDVQGHVRHAGGRGAAEGGRPRQSVRPQRDQHRAAVRDHRGSAGVVRHHGPDAVAARLPQAGGQLRRACRK